MLYGFFALFLFSFIYFLFIQCRLLGPRVCIAIVFEKTIFITHSVYRVGTVGTTVGIKKRLAKFCAAFDSNIMGSMELYTSMAMMLMSRLLRASADVKVLS